MRTLEKRLAGRRHDDSSNGMAPAEISFTAGPNQIFTFHPVQGEWACGRFTPFEAEGATEGVCLTTA